MVSRLSQGECDSWECLAAYDIRALSGGLCETVDCLKEKKPKGLFAADILLPDSYLAKTVVWDTLSADQAICNSKRSNS